LFTTTLAPSRAKVNEDLAADSAVFSKTLAN
jgi:hypothetical protein